jgi:sporulation protein YlmC with PRC-barrel domain
MQVRALYAAPLLACCLALPAMGFAQAAGGVVLGVTETVAAEIAHGWSIKKSILGKDVYNDDAKPAVVGKVDDVIINPKGAVSYAIVNASKYLGMSSHDVMIPVEQFKIEDQRITLAGATKDALRKLPEFKYAPNAGKAIK